MGLCFYSRSTLYAVCPSATARTSVASSFLTCRTLVLLTVPLLPWLLLLLPLSYRDIGKDLKSTQRRAWPSQK